VLTLWDRLRQTLAHGPVVPGARLGVPGELETYPQTPRRRHARCRTLPRRRAGRCRAAGTIACSGGTFAPLCTSQQIVIDLAVIPPPGTHRLQLQNPKGPFSNELPICVGSVGGCL
jgi:hypothetical protein